jgi:formin 2
MTSKKIDSHIIRDVLINFDNQLLSYETLNSLYALRPQEDELKMIIDYVKNGTSNSEELLDKPETFLLELSRIPAFDERLYCLVYQNKLNESLSSIEFRLNNVNIICDELLNSDKIRKILGIVLACGNNMNATNKSRGDADGFDLAILPNLKDVKSKDNQTNLLQYIAYFYVNKIDDDLTKLPIPDPSDFSFVAQVNFDEIEKELKRINNELEDIEKRIENVLKIEESQNVSSPFKSRVDEFLVNAKEECKEQEEIFTKCKTKFIKLVKIYCIKPKASEKEVSPEYLFAIWASFCQDFKDAWKRESQKIAKLRLKQVNEKRIQIKSSNKTETKPVETKKSMVNLILHTFN